MATAASALLTLAAQPPVSAGSLDDLERAEPSTANGAEHTHGAEHFHGADGTARSPGWE